MTTDFMLDAKRILVFHLDVDKLMPLSSKRCETRLKLT